MPSINRVEIMGHLGRSPELKYTQGGMALCNFSVATSSGKDERRETEQHNITCFNKTAEFIAEYAEKGSMVFLEGRIKTEEWTDKRSGEKKSTKKIIAHSVLLMDRKARGEDSPAESTPPDDDIPF